MKMKDFYKNLKPHIRSKAKFQEGVDTGRVAKSETKDEPFFCHNTTQDSGIVIPDSIACQRQAQDKQALPTSPKPKELIIKGTKQEVEAIIQGLRQRFGDIPLVEVIDKYGKETLILQ